MGESVFLIGEAAEVGAVQGKWQRAVLLERIERTFAHAEATGKSAQLQERATRFENTLAGAAPHWIEEATALAQTAGCEPWQVLAINCLPSDFWGTQYRPAPLTDLPQGRDVLSAYEAQGYEPMMGGDCTTFIALGEATVSGETMFHKNRDERDEIQCIYIKHLTGTHRFIGGGDIGNLGTAHLHTEDYWVGGNNTGSAIASEEFVDCALSDAHALRWLAERCASLDDIVPQMQILIDNGWLGGGGTQRGTILIFADATRGLVVEATSKRMAHQWFEESGDIIVRTNHFLLPEMVGYETKPLENSLIRYDRAVELLEAQQGLIALSTCGEVGRDRANVPDSICRNPSDNLGSCTVSTSTATISTHDDQRCQTHFRNCHPSYTHSVIVTPLDRVSDSDLVSGAHNQYWRNYRQFA